jgi:cytochrome c oxidase cbb3-type subunit IV
MALAVGVLIYTFWPSNKKRFQDAKKSILDEDDKPWM